MTNRSQKSECRTCLTSCICLRSLKLLVHLYRNTLGIVLPNSCRYQPTCSQYALDALTEHGAVRGLWLAVKRIGRCHPWTAGGFDPVPEHGSGGRPQSTHRHTRVRSETQSLPDTVFSGASVVDKRRTTTG